MKTSIKSFVALIAITFSFVFVGTLDAVPVDGLVAYYPFDGNACDLSGNGNHGTVYGASLTGDQSGNPVGAYSFDGVDDFIRTWNNIGNPPSGTILVWANAAGYDTGYNMLNLLVAQSDNFQIGLGDSSIGEGGWVFRIHDGLGGNYGHVLKSVVGPLVSLNTWTQVVGTWDSSKISLFVNGLEVASLIAGPPIPATGDLIIGAHSFAPQNYWNGMIGEVRIYDRALSGPEIQELYNSVVIPEPSTSVLFGALLLFLIEVRKRSKVSIGQLRPTSKSTRFCMPDGLQNG